MKNLIILFITISSALNAEDLKLPKEIRESVHLFAIKIGSGQIKDAVGDLYASKIKWCGDGPVKNLIERMRILNEETVGKPLSSEICRFNYYSQSYLSVSTIITFERQPVFIKIFFYKPGKDYKFDDISLNTNAEECLKDGFFDGTIYKDDLFMFKLTDDRY